MAELLVCVMPLTFDRWVRYEGKLDGQYSKVCAWFCYSCLGWLLPVVVIRSLLLSCASLSVEIS